MAKRPSSHYFCIPLAIRDDNVIIADDSAGFDCPSAEAACIAAQGVTDMHPHFCGCIAFAHRYDHVARQYMPVEVLKRCSNLEWSSELGIWTTDTR